MNRPLLWLPLVLACVAVAEPQDLRIDADRMLADLEFLSSDEMDGRQTGTDANARARRYVADRFAETGLRPFGTGYDVPFGQGTNVVGFFPGAADTASVIVITAHFDHLGNCGGEICNGADDNASGTAAIIAMARYLADHALDHTVIFAAFDAEESGLLGARAFVDSPPVSIDRIKLNVNLDMVSHSDSTLFIAGGHHYPMIPTLLEPVRDGAAIHLAFGHDRPELGADDWTSASDHGPFHARGVPFVYFGVEDHPDYHKPTDEFASINQDFYVQAVETILEAVLTLDAELARVNPE